MSDTTKAKAGHTPGPWVYQDDEFIVAGAWPYGSTICVLDAKNRQANARLIAAAPAMLAALEDIAGRGPVPGYGSGDALLVRLAGIQSIARAALSAATGEG